MAKFSIKMALAAASAAALVGTTTLPTQAAALWGERFANLRASSVPNGGWKWSLIQYRAYKYDQRLSRVLGRPASPFCRFFC